jgi:hypothetical protein
MHACGLEWQKMKETGATADKTWFDFARICLAKWAFNCFRPTITDEGAVAAREPDAFCPRAVLSLLHAASQSSRRAPRGFGHPCGEIVRSHPAEWSLL